MVIFKESEGAHRVLWFLSAFGALVSLWYASDSGLKELQKRYKDRSARELGMLTDLVEFVIGLVLLWHGFVWLGPLLSSSALLAYGAKDAAIKSLESKENEERATQGETGDPAAMR